MFFLLSKTVGYFCYPLSLFFLGLVLFVALRKCCPRGAWACFWVAAVILWGASTPWGTEALLRPLQEPYRQHVLPPKVDAIVVLGGALDLDNSSPGQAEYNPAADRLIYGVRLARRYPRAVLVFSGGTASLFDKVHTEAPLLRDEAIALGTPPQRILIEDRSRNTRENAVESKRVLAPTKSTSVVLVTSAFHMKRALACFRKAGLPATPYAVDFRGHRSARDPFGWVPEANNLAESTSAIREYVGALMYRLQGYI